MTKQEAQLIARRHLARNYLAWELARALEVLLKPQRF